MRKFNENQRAIAGLSEEFKEIKKIQFCPAKSDRFAVLTENSTQVNVYRFEEQNNNLSRETIRCEPAIFFKFIKNNYLLKYKYFKIKNILKTLLLSTHFAGIPKITIVCWFH